MFLYINQIIILGLHGLFPGPSPLQGAADLSAGKNA